MQKADKKAANAVPNDSLSTTAGFSYDDLELGIAEMLKAGVHFGHRSSRWNPKMKEFTFGTRNGIHIIDLEKTFLLFQKAIDFLSTVVRNGGRVLFVGTKPQAREIVKSVAIDLDMPFITNRWLGGTFTNFGEIKRRTKYLNDQEQLEASGELKKYTKYEQGKMKKEIDKMNEKMGGIKKMEGLPQAVFLVDIRENIAAIREAKRAGVPVVAIADTNTDPTLVDFPIPANDDALSSIRYILGIVAKTLKRSKEKPSPVPAQEKISAKISE